jgi:hypothetical protein
VSKQRYVVCVVAACLVTALAPACAAGQTPLATACDPCQLERVKGLIEEKGLIDCRLRSADEGVLRGYLRDGRVHLRIRFEEGVDPLHTQAFQAAMAMWNRWSPLTGFVLDEATVDMLPDISLRKIENPAATAQGGQQDAKVNCATYANQGSYIWYSPTNAEWLKNEADLPAAARIYAHELGHALGLAHQPVDKTSIVRGGDPNALCRDVAKALPDEVPKFDAENVYRCGCRLRLFSQGQNPAPSPAPR